MILSKINLQNCNVENLIRNKIENGKSNEILLIVPTNRKVRFLTNQLLDLSKNKALIETQIHTLSTLSIKLFEELFPDEYFILDDATAVIKLNKIINETELKYFPKGEEIYHGILLEIKNVISELKLSGVTSKILQSELELVDGSEKNKLVDLIKIFNKYNLECKNHNLFELGDIYEHLINVDKNKFNLVFRNLFPQVDNVVITGFDEFSNPETKILNLIADIIPNTIIEFDHCSENLDLFEYPLKSIEKFKNLGFNEVAIEENSENSFINSLKKNLFKIKNQPKVSNVKLKLVTLSDKQEEISFIARLVKHYLNDLRYQTNQICIAFNQISNYSKIIDEIFEDYGIPYNLTDRFLISEAPPVISLINFLEVIENDFYYKNLFRALSGRWIEIPSVDKVNLIRVSSNLKIVAGYENWINKLNQIVEEIDNEIETEFEYLPKDSYLKAKEDIETIYELISPFKYKLHPKEFFEKINNLISKLDLISKAINDEDNYVEKNTRAITKFFEMLENITEVIELEYGNKKLNLEFYLRNIKSASRFTRYNIKEKPGVLITSIEEIRGLRFKVLILGGMVDGEFPTRYLPEIFIPEKYKILERGHALKERYKFYQALKTAEDEIIFTHSKKSGPSDLTKSNFINELSYVFNLKEIDNRTFLDSLICSNYELRKNLSLEDLSSLETEILNEHLIKIDELKRKCQADIIRRETPFENSEYNGFVSSDTDLSIFYSEWLRNQKFSATKIEEFVKCPFQFLLKRILNLQPIKEPTEEIEPFEIGKLLHLILFEFYQKINSENITLQGCSDEEFDNLLNLIFEVARKKIDETKFSNPISFYYYEKIFGLKGEKKYSILYKFLETERNYAGDLCPFMFEKIFEFDENFEDSEIDRIKLTGTIDRIDINNQKKIFSIIDYKLSGKTVIKDDIIKGFSLQLPMYLFIAKEILQQELQLEYEPFSAEFYSLKLSKNEFGRKIFTQARVKNPNEITMIQLNNELIDIFKSKLKETINKIKNCEFHLSKWEGRKNKICQYCDFSDVCREREIIGVIKNEIKNS
jgi:ATP-dependent helicase/nuclease subunit B